MQHSTDSSISAPRRGNLRACLGQFNLIHLGLPPWTGVLDLPNRFSQHQCFAARVMHIVAPAIDWECQSDDCATSATVRATLASLAHSSASPPVAPASSSSSAMSVQEPLFLPEGGELEIEVIVLTPLVALRC